MEDLAAGDLAITAAGEQRRIRWIGHRTFEVSRCAHPEQVKPVRVAADAFGPNRPERDLFVSRGHALAVTVVDEVLIPAGALINGASVASVEVDTVTYWHVELDSHDILLANGLPAESYMDVGNRAGLIGEADLAPERGPATLVDYCRPFHDHGPVVDAVNARLRACAEQLGWVLQAQSVADIHIEADGVVIRPDTRGDKARFLVPAGTRDLVLVSPTTIPSYVSDNRDGRVLGLDLRTLVIGDGFGELRAITPDDVRLTAGFYHLEDSHRWTDGQAHLPASLWAECPDSFFLTVECGAFLPRWVEGSRAVHAVETVPQPRLRVVAAA